MKSDGHIEWNFEGNLAGMIDECAVVRVAQIDSRQAFAEILGVSELHRDDELAGLVDVAPFAGVRDQADAVSSFTDIDGRDAFEKIVDNVELWLNNDPAGCVNELFLF